MTAPTLANRYTLLRPLGEGAMGLVWLAKDPIEDREVALKVISTQVGASEKSVLQFKQEFQLMTQLRHPHCCAVYDFGVSSDGEPYFTMEVVPGHGVDERLPMAPGQVRGVLTQLLLALGYLHQLGFVHRDIKAANVRVRPDGTVKLMDFGLMDVVGRSSGVIAGTVGYIAPEVVQRSGVDQRADLYAAGCLAYEMLTGRVPFVRSRAIEVLRAHVSEAPEPLGRLLPGLDAALSRVVMTLLAKEPIDRFQSAFEALEALGAEVPDGIGGSLLTSPMVGRETEQAALLARLADVAAGRPGGAVAVIGSAGIGKSRLTEEFRFAVQLAAVPGGLGACHERERTPYGPMAGALRSLLPALRAHVPDVLDRLATVLVKLLPELDAPPAPELEPPSKEKLRLQGAVAEALAALAGRAGLVLILEDWHWADPLSEELWGYMVRQLADAPALLVVTRRDAPTSAGTPEAPTGAWDAVARLPLAPLDAAGLARMVGSMLGAPVVGAGLLAQLAEASQGSPLYVEELLDHLVRTRVLAKAAGRWNMDVALTPELMPSSLHGLLLDKLEGLSPDALAVLDQGAVLGGRFALAVIARATGLGDDRLVAALNALKRQQVLTIDASGAHRFAHDQLVGVLAQRLSADARRRLHASAARALQPLLTDEPPLELLTALADHSLAGGLDAAAVGHALAAGRRSAALYANADAERYFSAGLALLNAQGDAAPDARLAYEQGLADVLRVQGRIDEAGPLYASAIALAELELLDHAALARMLTSLAKVHQMANRLEEGIAACHRAVQVALQAGERGEAIRSLLTSCRLHTFLGHADKALDHAKRALDLAEAEGDTGRTVEALAFIGFRLTSSGPGDIDAGIAKLHEAVRLATALGDKVALINVQILLGNALNQLGDHRGARGAFVQAQALSHEVGAKPDVMTSLLNLAICDLALGRFAEAGAHTAACRAVAVGESHVFFRALAEGLEALVCAHRDEADAALAHLRAALGLAEQSQNRYMETLVRQYQVEASLRLGDWAGCLAAAQALAGAAPDALMLALEGEALARSGDRDGARQAIDRSLELARGARARSVEARALAARAGWAIGGGDWGRAREDATAALALASDIGLRHLEAELHGLLGELALATGQGEAAAHFGAMAMLAAAMGTRGLAAVAQFGQAAAAPYAPGAGALAAEARQAMDALISAMSPDAQAAYGSLRERRRVLEGKYICFSLPMACALPGESDYRPGPMGLHDGLRNL